jgi:phospholipid/cholesterol/gamma-HCH transport system substrate-binding protein
VKKALKTYTRDFIALIVLAAIGLAALFIILSQQASALPSWFPFLGEDRFELRTELQTAQAVTPGQGQSVDISGVKVGDVTKVELENGVAVVTMQVDNEYSDLIHDDASVLLRPRTGLQDMVIELDPGTQSAPTVPEGFTVPLADSAPNVNPDQILASLDGDTRAYLRLLLAGGAQALGTKAKSDRFADVLRRFYPTTRDLAKVNGALARRRDNLRHVITNFKLIAEELAKADTNLSGFVRTQNQVFGAFAEQEQNLRTTVRDLPGALRETRSALNASASLSRVLGPTLTDLIPQAQALKPALQATRPFFRQTLPSVRDQIRPFTNQVSRTVRDVKRGSQPLNESVTALDGSFTELNQVLNALAYNPPGEREGYLFYLAWVNHNLNSTALLQDGLGPMQRSLLTYTCFTSFLADNAVATRPDLKTARDLVRLPTTAEICPPPWGSAPAAATADGSTNGDSGSAPNDGSNGAQSGSTGATTTTTAPSTSTSSTTTTAPETTTTEPSTSTTTPAPDAASTSSSTTTTTP